MTDNIRSMIDAILSEKEAKNGLHINAISTHIFNESGNLFQLPEDKLNYDDIKKKVNSILAADVKKKSGGMYVKVKNSKTGKDKKGFYKKKPSKPTLPNDTTTPLPILALPPETVVTKPKKDNLFVGKAGECAVMSELLFRGYNVNQMLVDDGVDIVASKNNLFYFIQVKTTNADANNKIYASVKTKRFETFIGSQIRYIIVARCNISGIDTNLYFTFNNNDIQKYLFQEYINGSDSNLNIKIRIDKSKNNRPILYNENKETDITFHMNRFDL